jgi:hypothetical protein
MVCEIKVIGPRREFEAQPAKFVIRDPSVRRTGYRSDAEPQRDVNRVLRGSSKSDPVSKDDVILELRGSSKSALWITRSRGYNLQTCHYK